VALKAAVVVDSRNAYHQAGDVIGVKALPSVSGVVAALDRFGYTIERVHVGLALARPRDMVALKRQHEENSAYRDQVLADPRGTVLLGELHVKSDGRVEEKIVDVACCVQITRLVAEIYHGTSNLDALVVISRDIDLTPAYDYAGELGVPLTVAAPDVIQHRGHPYLMLGPHSFAEIVQRQGGNGGHDLRELLAGALHDGRVMEWTVDRRQRTPLLRHRTGLVGIPADRSVRLPADGQHIELFPVNASWNQDVNGSFPLLVLGTRPSAAHRCAEGRVLRRRAPNTIELRMSDGSKLRAHYPLGGLVNGDTVVVQETGRALGRLADGRLRRFDPDPPTAVTVVAMLKSGGVLARDSVGTRGLVISNQVLGTGARLPVVQIDENRHGAVWQAIGTPLPHRLDTAKGRRKPPLP
jgi:hypothetical protein